MTSHELSYATVSTPPVRRWLIRTIENLSGRRRLLKTYHRWRAKSARGPRMWNDALDMIGTRLEINAPADWHARLPDGPLVIIANHPFGIADGIAILSLAERIGRPYRLLLNADFMRLPEVQALGLPIDFNATKEALATNLKTRNEARRLLKEGVTLVIFPAGGVATAEMPFGTAEELPWKLFTARLIRQSGATVLPVYFEGQNSALFHFVSRYSLSLRLALLVLEFRHHIGTTIGVTVGPPVSWTEIAASANGGSIIDELYVQVHRMAPGAENADRTVLLPRPIHERRRYPWDPPREPTQRAPGGPSGESAEMETALADVLGQGAAEAKRLSLGDPCAAVGERIKDIHGLNGVIPQCHTPRQVEGDISRIPLFVAGGAAAPRIARVVQRQPPALQATVSQAKPAAPDASYPISSAASDWVLFQIETTGDLELIKKYIAQYETREPLWAHRAQWRLQPLAAQLAGKAGQHRPADIAQQIAKASDRKTLLEFWQADPKRVEARLRELGYIYVPWREQGKPVNYWVAAGESLPPEIEGAPEMVPIPPGKFWMGSTDGYFEYEAPRHEVTIPSAFAVGKYAVTFAEWLFAQEDREWQKITGIAPRTPADEGWGRDRRPVIDVNWNDAKAYVKWLSAKTGQTYRLLSEAEWEYACRAGTVTVFWWGDSITTDQANYDGNYTFGGGPKGEHRQRTVPVDFERFKPNPWGLYQMHGNMWEWCEDAWHDSYKDKPAELKNSGAAWTSGGDTDRRVLRGGSWCFDPLGLRAAYRYWVVTVDRLWCYGFRLARTLPPAS